MHRHWHTVLGLTALIAGAGLAQSKPALIPASAAPYTISDLGTLGGSESGAYAINNKGEVVGWSDKGGASGDLLYTDAFIWQEGTMHALSLVLAQHPFPAAFALNDRGQVLVHAEPHTRGTARLDIPMSSYALLWQNNTVTELRSLTPNTLNNKGQVVGWFIPRDAGWPQPTLWEQGRTRYLKSPSETDNVQARAINDQGEVAGVWSGKDVSGRAFVTRRDETTVLDTPAGYKVAEALCINNKGQVVVWAWSESGHAVAFLWQPSLDAGKGEHEKRKTLTALGRLGGEDHWAYGLNNLGQVVGSSGGRAFLWSSGKMIGLNTLVPAASGWLLREGRGINDKGQICGNGMVNGQRRAFLLTPGQR